MSAGKYAILREMNTTVDAEAACAVIAPIVGMAQGETAMLLRDRPGILLWDLDRECAQKVLAGLHAQGMTCFGLPQKKLVALPETLPTRELTVAGEAFRVPGPSGALVVSWSEVLCYDVVRIRSSKRERVVSMGQREHYGRYGATRAHMSPTYRERLEWIEYLDVICYEPWTHLRINKSDFRYPRSGLPMHPTRERNFLGLAVTFQTRAEKAFAGGGINDLFDGKPETRQSLRSEKAHENHIMWLLQMAFRKK